jgi:hypothetical protein
MLHQPLTSVSFDASMFSKSNTATATENVDMGGVSWKCTQVHPVLFTLETQITTVQLWYNSNSYSPCG